MSDDIDSLKRELEAISRRVHALKAIYVTSRDEEMSKQLREEIKGLQWQAMIYLEKVRNKEGA